MGGCLMPFENIIVKESTKDAVPELLFGATHPAGTW
jgi:hypothetical protein